MAIDKLKGHVSTGTDQISAELITAGVRKFRSEFNKPNLCWIRRNCLRCGRSRSLYVFVRRGFIVVPIHKKRDKTDVINYRGIAILSTTYKIFSKIALSWLTPYAEGITRDNQWDFDANCSHWPYFLHSSNIWIKWENTKQCVSCL